MPSEGTYSSENCARGSRMCWMRRRTLTEMSQEELMKLPPAHPVVPTVRNWAMAVTRNSIRTGTMRDFTKALAEETAKVEKMDQEKKSSGVNARVDKLKGAVARMKKNVDCRLACPNELAVLEALGALMLTVKAVRGEPDDERKPEAKKPARSKRRTRKKGTMQEDQEGNAGDGVVVENPQTKGTAGRKKGKQEKVRKPTKEEPEKEEEEHDKKEENTNQMTSTQMWSKADTGGGQESATRASSPAPPEVGYAIPPDATAGAMLVPSGAKVGEIHRWGSRPVRITGIRTRGWTRKERARQLAELDSALMEGETVEVRKLAKHLPSQHIFRDGGQLDGRQPEEDEVFIALLSGEEERRWYKEDEEEKKEVYADQPTTREEDPDADPGRGTSLIIAATAGMIIGELHVQIGDRLEECGEEVVAVEIGGANLDTGRGNSQEGSGLEPLNEIYIRRASDGPLRRFGTPCSRCTSRWTTA